jgi:threonine/homoserine/homoserine lactone efflux protein
MIWEMIVIAVVFYLLYHGWIWWKSRQTPPQKVWRPKPPKTNNVKELRESRQAYGDVIFRTA